MEFLFLTSHSVEQLFRCEVLYPKTQNIISNYVESPYFQNKNFLEANSFNSHDTKKRMWIGIPILLLRRFTKFFL